MKKSLIPAAVAAALCAVAVSPSVAGLAETQAALRGVLKTAAPISGRAPIQLVVAQAPVAARNCWVRGENRIADSLGLPRTVCLDSVRVQEGQLIVAGDPVSGSYRLLPDGRAIVANVSRGEGACESADSALIYVNAAGVVTGIASHNHDVCHSQWEDEVLTFRRAQ